MGSTTNQLERWGHTHIKKSQGFMGVYAADRLPNPDSIAVPATCVVNYDLSTMPGSHWSSISVKPSSVLWFDSYGLAPDSPDLLIGHRTNFREWLSRICKRLGLNKYEYNHADLQSPGQNTCGLWALYFAQNGPNKNWEPFGPDREHNDHLIRRLVRL